MQRFHPCVPLRHVLGPALASVMLLSFVLPRSAAADTDLDIGGLAVIAYANGDNVRLRTGPSYDDPVISSFAEGTAVDVIDGTFPADDGTSWYEVVVGGQQGFIVSDYLAASSGLFGETSGSAVATDSLNVRTGPSTVNGVVTTIGSGDRLDLTGENIDGWLSVSTAAGDGYAYGAFLSAENGENSVDASSGPTGERVTNDSVNLRSGPSLDDGVVTELAAGTPLTLSGRSVAGFAEVDSAAGAGWVWTEYIGEASSGNEGAPSDQAAGTRYTNDAINLRTDPSIESGVVAVLPLGTTLDFTGSVEGRFAQVSGAAGDGWVAAEYLSVNFPSWANMPPPTVDQNEEVDATDPAPVEEPAPEEEPVVEEEPSSLVVWPVEGGEWEISQGYNGSSHQNRTDLWQYRYSFDLVRTDGSTTGQPVYSPVDSTIRWFDESTGGVSIDMGDGLGYAIFHADYDPGLSEGDVISQGQYLGTISGPGGGGNGGFPHLHITVWNTSDGSNWSREAIPFTGAVAIEGIEFPIVSGTQDHRGYIFNP